MTRALGWAALAAVVIGGMVGPATAMSLAPAPVTGARPDVTLVADGCGPFGHRSHFGYCKPNGPGPGFDGPPRVYGGYREGGYEEGGYGGPRLYERHCFVRETYDGPRRICR